MATNADPSTPPDATGTDAAAEAPFLTPQRLRLFGIIGGALIIVGLAAWFMITAGKRKESFAARALEAARSTAEQGNIGEAVQQFQQVATTYSGTSAAYDAVLGIAQARMIAGQTELAISTLEDFLGKNPPKTYASPGHGLLGTALENTGKFADAATAYRKASDEADIPFLKATLLLDAARASGLAGQADQARAAYQEVLDKYGETAARSEAEVRLAELEATPAS